MTGRDLRLGLLCFGVPAVLFLAPLLAGNVHFAGDVLYSFHPWLSYAAQELQAGRFPLWNPFSNCGEAFAANPQTMLFFPAAQVFWLWPFPRAWGAFLALQHAALWIGVFLCAKRWSGRRWAAVLAATALCWSGFTTVLWEFPAAVATLSLAPLAVLFAATRRPLLFSLAAALLLFAGYAPLAAFSLLLAGAIFIAGSVGDGRSHAALPASAVGRGLRTASGLWAVFAAAALAGLALSACQLLPSWEAARHSIRAALTGAEARAFVFPPALFLKLLMPAIIDKVALPFGEPVFGAGYWAVQRNWLTTLTIGTAPFLLGAAALLTPRRPREFFWSAAAVLAAALACGVEPLFFLFRKLPGLSFLAHYSQIVWLALAALAFSAADSLARRPDRGASPNRRALPAVYGAAVAAAAALALSPGLRQACLSAMIGAPALSAAQDAFVCRAAWTSLGSLGAVGLAFLLSGSRRTAALCVITLAELWLFQSGLHPVAHASFFSRPAFLAEALRAEGGRFAVHPDAVRGGKPMAGATREEGYQSLRQALYPNVQLPFRIRSPWGYEVSPVREFAEFRRTFGAGGIPSAAADFLAIGHVLSTSPLPAPLELIARAPNALLYSNSSARPLTTWVPQAMVLPAANERLDLIARGWRPDAAVIMDSPVPAGPAREGRITAADEKPGRAAARGEGSGFIVRSEVFYPGWEVYVEGRREELRRGNHAFQAVSTPEGPWEATFVFRPRSFRLGLLLTLAVLAALAAAGIRRLKRFTTL